MQAYSHKVSDAPLSSIAIQERCSSGSESEAGQQLAVGNENGEVYILQLCGGP